MRACAACLAVGLLLPFVLSPAAAQERAAVPRIDVPHAAALPVMLDGRLSPGEWDDARPVSLGGGVRLLVKESAGHVFLGVVGGVAVPRPVDLFLQDATGAITQLHASMQIGERRHADTLWGDWVPGWHWGNHVDWLANEAKLDEQRPAEASFTSRLFPGDITEFQVRRARFPGDEWRVRIEVNSFPGTDAPPVVFPGTASRDPGTWAVLRLD